MSALECSMKSSIVVHIFFNLSACKQGILRLRVSGCSDYRWRWDWRSISFLYSFVQYFSVDVFAFVMPKKCIWIFEQLKSNLVEIEVLLPNFMEIQIKLIQVLKTKYNSLYQKTMKHTLYFTDFLCKLLYFVSRTCIYEEHAICYVMCVWDIIALYIFFNE